MLVKYFFSNICKGEKYSDRYEFLAEEYKKRYRNMCIVLSDKFVDLGRCLHGGDRFVVTVIIWMSQQAVVAINNHHHYIVDFIYLSCTSKQ